jgi:hypothetical protein
LLKKAEEIRLENGPAKIEAAIEDVQRLAQQDTNILDEVFRYSYAHSYFTHYFSY